MINYLGCALFGLFFLVMTGKTGGLHTRLTQTLSWFHDWAPFSYFVILIMLVAVGVSLKLMSARPEEKEPEDFIIEYRHEGSDTEDSPAAAEECVEAGVSEVIPAID
jgi:hypothetical protein